MLRSVLQSPGLHIPRLWISESLGFWFLNPNFQPSESLPNFQIMDTFLMALESFDPKSATIESLRFFLIMPWLSIFTENVNLEVVAKVHNPFFEAMGLIDFDSVGKVLSELLSFYQWPLSSDNVSSKMVV